jgi:hypothetical protein
MEDHGGKVMSHELASQEVGLKLICTVESHRYGNTQIQFSHKNGISYILRITLPIPPLVQSFNKLLLIIIF